MAYVELCIIGEDLFIEATDTHNHHMETRMINRLENLEKRQLRLRLILCAILLAVAVVMLFSFKSPKEGHPKKELQMKELTIEEKRRIAEPGITCTGMLIQDIKDIEWENGDVHDDELAILIPGLP